MFATLLSLALLQAATPPLSTPLPNAQPPAKCASEAYGGFDFWIGSWDVFANGSETKVAESLIERVSAGCVIRETWMPLRGGSGTSMSFLNHRSGRWDQVWVGGDGKRVDFTGGMVDNKMVLIGYWDGIGPGGEDQLIRMTYSRHDDGSVRQLGEASTDHGNSWQTSFDFVYRPKERGQQ